MKKRKFNWLDGVTIALVLLLIAGGLWYFLRGRKPASQEKDYLLTLRFTQTTEDPYDFYKVGDTLYFYTRSKPVGKITSLRQLDTVYEAFDRTAGQYREMKDERWNTVEMQVAVKGVMENGVFSVNGDSLYMGLTFYPQTDTTRSSMVVWGVEEVQK